MNMTHQSLWMETAPDTPYPPLDGDRSVDVAVIGGGITGLTAALLLKEQGASVAVLERHRIATGTTGYTTAKVTLLHGLIYSQLTDTLGEDAAGLYALANGKAIERILRTIERYNIACDFGELPAYTYADSEEHVSQIWKEVEACNRLGILARFVDAVDLPYAVAGAVRVDGQVRFHPRKYCLALAAAIDGGGSGVFEASRGLDVEDGEPCVVTTDRGIVRARHVIVATLLPFLMAGEFFAKTHPSRSYALAARIEGDLPAGMFLSHETPTRSVRPHRSPEGDFLIIEGEEHKTGQDQDTRQRYKALETWAHRRFPIRSIDYRWSAQDYMTGDHVPFAGPISSRMDNVLVATGFNKWGMSNGTAAAMLMSELVQGREVPWLRLYDAGRLDLKHSAGTLLRENLDVARRFVGDRVGTLRAVSVTDLPEGDAGLVKSINGELVAAYRDNAGTLHAVSPDCTHMGCRLHWNTAEKTWDCPCHGSRFGYDGTVLEGPATQDLQELPAPAASPPAGGHSVT